MLNLSRLSSDDINREIRKYYGFQKNIAIVSAFVFAKEVHAIRDEIIKASRKTK